MSKSNPDALPVHWLETVFYQSVGRAFNTILRGGADEPLYIPARGGQCAEIHYRQDYLRSALHEVAHWCLAGAARRRLPDYGYWYAPDGRNSVQQDAFFAVEARPQALEQCFCHRLAVPFSISIDNPGAVLEVSAIADFERRVQLERAQFLKNGLPERAMRFAEALGRC